MGELVAGGRLAYLAARVSRSRKRLGELLEEVGDPGRVERLLGALFRAGHHSVFEHSFFRLEMDVPLREARRSLAEWRYLTVTGRNGVVTVSLNGRTAMEMLRSRSPEARRVARMALRLCPELARPLGLDLPGDSGWAPRPGRTLAEGGVRVTPLVVSRHEDSRHGFASLLIEGVTRVTSHQIVRHRSLSIVQQSQRHSEVTSYRLPEGLGEEAARYVEEGIRLYRRLVESGVPLEDARYVLPQACLTRMVASGRMDAWIHFVELRDSPEAQWEIRIVARLVRRALSI
ncbi:MAG: hypothetical protein DRO06_03300 [Thermoproteota archaeon]|nr:MAG: hypothetical protein DRO06_03300 [Candidatus Korarchaeota archaeon]